MTPRWSRLGGAVLLAMTLGACAPQSLLLRGLADELARPDSIPEDDLLLLRDAAPFHLKLSESVLRQDPGHLPLAASVAGGFTQYAYAFVAFEAEKMESRDVKAAQLLQARAVRLYARAQGHALSALDVRMPGFTQRLRAEPSHSDVGLVGGDPVLPREAVPVAYWAAASWGARIALSKDTPEVVADLPQVQRLARMAWQVDPDHGQGALATLMGLLEMARPGGSAATARPFFDRAVEASGGHRPEPFMAMAESLALPAGDRAAFEAWLRRSLEVGASLPDTGSVFARERARWLLDTAEDRF